jgi:hypothetical protein
LLAGFSPRPVRIPTTADTAIINSSTTSKKECSFMQAANHHSLETLTAPCRAVILDTSSKSATEIVLRFRPVHQRVVAVPYPDGSALIPHSAGSTIVREFFQLRWHSSSREKIIFTARSAKELENPQSFLRQIGNVLDTINCQ